MSTTNESLLYNVQGPTGPTGPSGGGGTTGPAGPTGPSPSPNTVTNPTTSVTGNVAIFVNGTGKVIIDSGLSLSEFLSLGGGTVTGTVNLNGAVTVNGLLTMNNILNMMNIIDMNNNGIFGCSTLALNGGTIQQLSQLQFSGGIEVGSAGTLAFDPTSIAIGINSTTTATGAICIANSTTNSNPETAIIGDSGFTDISSGSTTCNLGQTNAFQNIYLSGIIDPSNGIRIGTGATTSDTVSIAIGNNSAVSGSNAISLGHNSSNSNANTAVIGGTGIIDISSGSTGCQLGNSNNFQNLYLSQECFVHSNIHSSLPTNFLSFSSAHAITINNTTAQTTIIPTSGSNIYGTLSFPANFVSFGPLPFHFNLTIFFNFNAALLNTLTWFVMYNGTSIGNVVTSPPTGNTSGTYVQDIVIYGSNLINTVSINSSGSSPVISKISTNTFNGAITTTFDVQVAWSAASASNTINIIDARMLCYF